MKLRTQMLLVGALVVSLPVAGWHFVQQIEQVLRSGQEQTLLDNARALASILASGEAARWPDAAGERLYIHPADQPFFLDGYSDEWEVWMDQVRTFDSGHRDFQVGFLAARNAEGLHLLLRVTDPRLVFADMGPEGRIPGDTVRLVFESSRGRQAMEISSFAPGAVEAGSRDGLRVRGQWQPVPGGWNLELLVLDGRIPDALGFAVAHKQRPGQREPVAVTGTGPPDDPTRLRPLVAPDPATNSRLQGLTPVGLRAWAVDARGYVLGRGDRRSGPSEEVPITGDPSWLRTLLFRRLASEPLAEASRRDSDLGRLAGSEVDEAVAGSPGARWQAGDGGAGLVVSAAVPVLVDGQVRGAVVVERDADAMLMLTSRAVMQLFGVTVLAFGVAVAVLLGFAALLTERIRRLRNAAEDAVTPDGRVQQALAPPRAADELGDLGRSVSVLLARLREHQDYLRTLADKLTHELRTPLSVIRSSLDNLDQFAGPAEARRYQQRARTGAERLNRILQAMSQAARIEQGLVAETPEDFDLAALLEEYLAARRDLHPDRQFELLLPDRSARVSGSPELIVQMLDKLADNAVDFSRAGSTIRFRLLRRGERVVIEVENEGPALPSSMGDRLFESMVSVRPARGDQPNLGLGLHVARIVVEHHGGTIAAANTETGVVFRVTLPVIDA